MSGSERSKKLEEFQQTIGIRFKNQALLDKALTHRSYINEHKISDSESNEKLEFLGDAVIGKVVCQHLFKEFPELDEGELSRLKSMIVSTSTLADAGRSLGLGRYLQLGKGETETGGMCRTSILADAFEALVGAIYLESGNAKTTEFIVDRLSAKIESFHEGRGQRDFKTDFQEFVQAKYHRRPVYRVISETGPGHDRTFEVQVIIDGKVCGQGSGHSKKQAEQEAARQAMEKINNNIES